MFIVYLPLLVCIIGAIVFASKDNPHAKALAKDLFWCGLLVTLLTAKNFIVR